MSSRRSVRQVFVAVLLGVLVGGGLMAVTPAGAEVSSAVATNWKKIWKKNLKPLADKRYYTKKQSDSRYAAAGSGYTKTESDGKYQPKGSYEAAGSGYSKAETDARFAPYPAVIRGLHSMGIAATNTSYHSGGGISFGYVLPSAPTPHYIAPGAVPPAQCPGTAERPDAQAGHLCVYGTVATNVSNVAITNRNTSIGVTEPFGAEVWIAPAAAGQLFASATWAVRPGSVSTNPPARTSESSSSRSIVPR